jgi:hypothetical protein
MRSAVPDVAARIRDRGAGGAAWPAGRTGRGRSGHRLHEGAGPRPAGSRTCADSGRNGHSAGGGQRDGLLPQHAPLAAPGGTGRAWRSAPGVGTPHGRADQGRDPWDAMRRPTITVSRPAGNRLDRDSHRHETTPADCGCSPSSGGMIRLRATTTPASGMLLERRSLRPQVAPRFRPRQRGRLHGVLGWTINSVRYF